MANPSVNNVIGWLDQFVDSVDFTRVGAGRALGLDIAETIVHGSTTRPGSGIMGRIDREVQPDGSPWPPNSEPYATDKEEKYGWRETNRRTSQMLSEVSLKGQIQLAPRQVTLVYGTGQPPSRSYSPTGHIEPGDRKTTDIEKAEFAHASGRGFYGIGQGDPENVSDVCQEALDLWIQQANGSNIP